MATDHTLDHAHDAHTHAGEEHPAHASVKTYVVIGAILTAITGVEVAVFYIDQLASVLVPTLLVLSAVKFVIVVMFYMHLKYDSHLFRRVFFGPMMLAILVVASLVIIFKAISPASIY